MNEQLFPFARSNINPSVMKAHIFIPWTKDQAIGKIWQKQFPLIQGSIYLKTQCKKPLFWVDGAHFFMSVTWRRRFPVRFPHASWKRDGASAMETWNTPLGILPLDLPKRKWMKHRPYTVSSLQKSHGLSKLQGMLLADTTFSHDSVVLTDLLVCIRARWLPSFHWKTSLETVNLIRNREIQSTEASFSIFRTLWWIFLLLFLKSEKQR